MMPDLPEQPTAEELINAGSGTAEPGQGQLRTAIANALVGLKKQYYGRGPTAAKTYICDDYVFVVMEGGLTRNEETLLEAGREALVREYRLSFQEAVTNTITSTVEALVGRRVIGYHSQIVFHPHRVFEIFVLEPEGG
ncbi:MAG: hypothetical protein QOK21_2700 [Solirubrobacteraceae bacterium]|jgi:uncharacterized protein YbcI|nr:hypothetical protein [Solirubrobacteraceae bacterium]